MPTNERNCTTKSIIFAPFNSTKTHVSVELSPTIKELLISRRHLKMGKKVKEIDRKYEYNNNAELDNGVFNKFMRETGDKDPGQGDDDELESLR